LAQAKSSVNFEKVFPKLEKSAESLERVPFVEKGPKMEK